MGEKLLMRRGIGVGVVFATIAVWIYHYNNEQAAMQNVNLAGKKALVFGGTKGIGLGLAEYLCKHGATVTISGRSKDIGEQVVQRLNELSGRTDNEFVQADISSVVEAQRVTSDYVVEKKQLDYLVLSPGIATFQGRTETKEGIDVKMALHYYSRVAIALAAGDCLAKSNGAAIFVLSAGVHAPFIPNDKDFDLKNCYSLKNAADAAGFYTDLAIESLAKKFPGARWVHACPGFVDSNWGEDLVAPVRWMIRGMQAVFATSIENCAKKLAMPLLAPERGWFLSDQHGKIIAPNEAQIEQSRSEVWEHTIKMLEERQ